MRGCGFKTTSYQSSKTMIESSTHALPLSPQSRMSGCYKLFDLAVFSSLMKYRRKELGISLRVAARQIGISASNLSRIEHEKFTPDLENYYKCCKWSNSQMEYFFNSL